MAEAERPSLRPLPAEAFDPTVALQAKADRKARISVRGSRYSVPASYAGRTVDVRLERRRNGDRPRRGPGDRPPRAQRAQGL